MDIPFESCPQVIFAETVKTDLQPRSRRGREARTAARGLSRFSSFPGRAGPAGVSGSPQDVFRGLVGRYGRVNGASHYVAFIGDTSAPLVQEALGYMGEGIILEAAALGLGTCWVGGFFGARSRPPGRVAVGERAGSVRDAGGPRRARGGSLREAARRAGRIAAAKASCRARPRGRALRLEPERSRGRAPRALGEKPTAVALPDSGGGHHRRRGRRAIPSRNLQAARLRHRHAPPRTRRRGRGRQGRLEFPAPPDVAKFVRDLSYSRDSGYNKPAHGE